MLNPVVGYQVLLLPTGSIWIITKEGSLLANIDLLCAHIDEIARENQWDDFNTQAVAACLVEQGLLISAQSTSDQIQYPFHLGNTELQAETFSALLDVFHRYAYDGQFYNTFVQEEQVSLSTPAVYSDDEESPQADAGVALHDPVEDEDECKQAGVMPRHATIVTIHLPSVGFPNDMSYLAFMLRRTVNPTALAYQCCSLISVFTIPTSIWVWFPDYELGLKDIWILLIFIGSALNNYNYARTSFASPMDKKEEMRAKTRELIETLTQYGFTDDRVNRMLAPKGISKLLIEARFFADVIILVAATVATLSVLFKDKLPDAVVISISLLAGVIQGIESTYNTVLSIGQEHVHADLYKYYGYIVPASGHHDAPFATAVADLSLLPWLMSVLGATLWAGAAFQSVMGILDIFDIQSSLASALLLPLAIFSGIKNGEVYYRYHVSQKFMELPTKRSLDNLSQAFQQYWLLASLGAVLPTLMLSFGIHLIVKQFTKQATPWTLSVVPTFLFSSLTYGLKNYQTWARFVGFALNFKWVTHLFHAIDKIHLYDKGTMTLLLSIMAGVVQLPILMSLASAGLYVTLSGYDNQSSRVFSRYWPARTALFAIAGAAFYLDFILKVNAQVHGDATEITPDKITMADQTPLGWTVLFILNLLASGFSARQDYLNTAARLVFTPINHVTRSSAVSHLLGLFGCRRSPPPEDRLRSVSLSGGIGQARRSPDTDQRDECCVTSEVCPPELT